MMRNGESSRLAPGRGPAPATSDPLGESLRSAVRVLHGWLDYQRVLHRVPALSVAIVRGDDVILNAAYGHADVATGRKATDATGYRIASITKTFTATAVMQLCERGLVRLDERVERYVPWFRSRRDTPLEAITVRQLLSHTGGVERDGTDHWVSDRFPKLEQLKARVQNGVAALAPLERWKYSNLGYAVLGAVVAAAAGQSYEDYVRAQILAPLGLASTGFAVTPRVVRTLAVGYGRARAGRRRETFPNPDTNAMRPAAGLISNATDLSAYVAAQFPGSGRLLSDLNKREMQRAQWVSDGEPQYGLGYSLWPVAGAVIVGHGGGFQGFKTAIGMDPARKIGVVVLTNAIDGPAQEWMTGIFHTIDDCATRLGRDRPTRRAPYVRRYEGRFTGRWWDVQLVEVGGRLLGYDPRGDRPLREVHELEYRSPGNLRIVSGPGAGHVGEAVTFQPGPRGVPRALRWGPNLMTRARQAESPD